MKPSRGIRIVVAGLPFVLAIAVFTVVYGSVRDRLPDPMATHYPGNGAPDGFSSSVAFLWTAIAILLGVGALLGGICAWQRPGAGRWIAVTSWLTAGLLGSTLSSALLVNAEVTDAHDARLPWWDLIAAGGIAVVAGAIGWLLTRHWPTESLGDEPAGPRIELRDGESAVWTRAAGSPQLTVVGVALLIGGVVAAGFAGWVLGAVLAASGLLTLAFARVRVTAGGQGVVVSPGGLPWPRIRIPLDRIEGASHRRLSAVGDFGGWGYRIRPGASGVILRSGEALVVRRAGGREFAVTVDDAATGAALLNSLVRGGHRGGRRGGTGKEETSC